MIKDGRLLWGMLPERPDLYPSQTAIENDDVIQLARVLCGKIGQYDPSESELLEEARDTVEALPVKLSNNSVSLSRL